MDTADVVYHGSHRGPSGAGAVAIETPSGDTVGVLAHVVRHSPTGFSWGYGGSGPADLARSLLIAALGDKANCDTCAGTRRIAWAETELEPRPFDLAVHPEGDAVKCFDCDDGYRRLPYHAFKFHYVAAFGDEWRMTRAEILDWLTAVGVVTR